MPLVNIGKIKINYHVIGQGKPLVLISGLGVDHRTWIFQIPFFQEYFKVIVFDNRGIGKSTGTIGPYSIEMMADDTKALIDYLKLEKTHILGSSMGGMISQQIAIKYPEIVDKLVLSSTSARPERNVLDTIKKGLKDLADFKDEDIINLKPRGRLGKKMFSFFLKQVFSDSFIKVNKNLIEDIINDMTKNPRYFETFIKQTRAILRHDVVDNLSKIKSDTFVITGKKDKILPPNSSDLLAEKIPNSKLYKIEDGTHGMHYEKSDLFNKKVFDFLKG